MSDYDVLVPLLARAQTMLITSDAPGAAALRIEIMVTLATLVSPEGANQGDALRQRAASLCASCADTAEMYGKLADAFLAYEQPLGLADGLGSFHPRLHRLVTAIQRAAFMAGWDARDGHDEPVTRPGRIAELDYAAWLATQPKEPNP